MEKLISLLFLLLVFINSNAEDVKNLESEIQEVIDKYHAVGVSVAVVKNNDLIYTRSFGYNPDYNDLNHRLAIPINGVYVIQSISKSFISTSIMQLVEKGKLGLDDDANNYLNFNIRNPKYPSVPITIRMLLAHRSSINDKHYSWSFDPIDPDKGSKWQECYNNYPPGTIFSYCNFNYNLLGAIIEKASGEKFFDYIDENITEPLGLNASFNLTKVDTTFLVKALIHNNKDDSFNIDTSSVYDYDYYYEKSRTYELGVTTPCFSPSGGMRISIVDLAKYMMMHMNYGEYNGKRIISKESELEMFKPYGEDNGNSIYFHNYGLSFSYFNMIAPGESLLGITGSAHGIHSAMYFSPSKKYGLVVICNGCTSDRPMKDSIAKLLYKYLIE